MVKLSELTDVTVDQTLLDARPPVTNPPVPSGVPYLKVLFYNDIAKRWNFNVRYIVFVLKRRLVSSSVALASNINSLLQWGELISIDGAETIYYARSNPTTSIGVYNGNNTLIKVAGQGAFVSRDSEQVVNAKKTIAAATTVGKNLTVIGELNPVGGTIDCGKYVGVPTVLAAPSNVVVYADNAYTVDIEWTSESGALVKNHVVEMVELGPYTGPATPNSSSSSSASSTSAVTLSWAAVHLANKTATSATINGLRPGVIYAFRVCTLTTTGDRFCSDISNTVAVLAYATQNNAASSSSSSTAA